jgi:hypothetical protein
MGLRTGQGTINKIKSHVEIKLKKYQLQMETAHSAVQGSTLPKQRDVERTKILRRDQS